MEEKLTFINYNDIFDMLIEKEEESIDIYNAFARMYENVELRKTFEQFARYEMGHINELINLRKQYPTGNFSNPITVVIRQEQPEPDDFKIMTYRDILEFAIEKERISELIYRDMADQVDNEEVKQLFLKNSDAERRHRLRIEKMLHFEDNDSNTY